MEEVSEICKVDMKQGLLYIMIPLIAPFAWDEEMKSTFEKRSYLYSQKLGFVNFNQFYLICIPEYL